MKWYKHDTSANMDAKLQEILLDYGLEGYGLYWYCLELIAANVTPDNLTFELEHDARIIARNTGSSVQKVEEMMTKFVDLGLFEANNGYITCLKLAKRTDDYTAKLIKKKPSQVPEIKEVRQKPTNSEKDPLEEIRLDKIRLDKNKNIEKTKTGKPSVFVPPDFSEVIEYARSRQAEHIAKPFYDYFDEGEWKDSHNNKVRNWKQKFITWQSRDSGVRSDQVSKINPNDTSWYTEIQHELAK